MTTNSPKIAKVALAVVGIMVVVGLIIMVSLSQTSRSPLQLTSCAQAPEGFTLGFTFAQATATTYYTYSTDGGRSWSYLGIAQSKQGCHSTTVTRPSDGTFQTGKPYHVQIRATRQGVMSSPTKGYAIFSRVQVGS